MKTKYCDYTHLEDKQSSLPKNPVEELELNRYMYLPYAIVDEEEFKKHLDTRCSNDQHEPHSVKTDKEVLLYMFDELCWTSEFTICTDDWIIDYYFVNGYFGKFLVIVCSDRAHEIKSIAGFKKGE